MLANPPDPELPQLSPAELRKRCAANQQAENVHEPFCFELFRRAILQRDERCWSEIVEHYTGMVLRWLRQVPGNNYGESSPDELVSTVFYKFWKSFRPEQLAKAERLASVLAYLKLCVCTCVQEERRIAAKRASQVELSELDQAQPPAGETMTTKLEAEEIFAVILGQCKDEAERVIAEYSFRCGLKPQEIYGDHPQLFANVAEVHLLKRNLIERLRRLPILRRLLAM